jgi:HlyD family secretion protein
VARARAALDAAEAQLALTRLTAPAAATVVARRAEPGDAVTPGQVLLELALDGRTEIVAFASEETLGELRPGAPGTVSADAYPGDAFPARVAWIAPAVDPAQGTIELRLGVPDPPAYLLPDMTVSVNLEVARRAHALVVPRNVVRRAGADSAWVLVAREGRAERRAVRVGIVAEGEVEIREGLAEGELVLPADIEAGARVRLAR